MDGPDEIRFADTAYISWDKFGWQNGLVRYDRLDGLDRLDRLEIVLMFRGLGLRASRYDPTSRVQGSGFGASPSGHPTSLFWFRFQLRPNRFSYDGTNRPYAQGAGLKEQEPLPFTFYP